MQSWGSALLSRPTTSHKQHETSWSWYWGLDWANCQMNYASLTDFDSDKNTEQGQNWDQHHLFDTFYWNHIKRRSFGNQSFDESLPIYRYPFLPITSVKKCPIWTWQSHKASKVTEERKITSDTEIISPCWSDHISSNNSAQNHIRSHKARVFHTQALSQVLWLRRNNWLSVAPPVRHTHSVQLSLVSPRVTWGACFVGTSYPAIHLSCMPSWPFNLHINGDRVRM